MAIEKEYLDVIQKLRDRTEEGKVRWRDTYDQNTFITTLERYSFEIRKSRNTYSLTMKDGGETELFELIAVEPDPDTSAENDKVHILLEDLYTRARRTALNVDQKVADVKNFLDNL
jgi:hypothetical protein